TQALGGCTNGQHTDAVLAGLLGFDADRLAELRGRGVLG
ncbi:MAG: hypothetical protein JWM76_2250, partial [Pseudonocardiales bacterium]|nr:hypothetical protein [Pseudonocardiales bacterium]